MKQSLLKILPLLLNAVGFELGLAHFNGQLNLCRFHIALASAYSLSRPLLRIVFSFWRTPVRCFWFRSGAGRLIHGSGAANWATNTSRMTKDMLISVGLRKVSLERSLACLRPSECIIYVKQSVVLTLAVLFVVEVQWIEIYNSSRTEHRHVCFGGVVLKSLKKSSVTAIQL